MVSVAAEFADVEQANWPQSSVDGITVNCSDERPQIFYRGDPDDVRTRFTIAHELGHAVLPWHLGNAECAMFNGQEYGRRSRFEKEADEFAAELLLPADWVRRIVRNHDADLNHVLRGIDQARVSATAGSIALSKLLPEGWALQINNQPLVIPHYYGVHRTRAQADRASRASGSGNVNGQTVRWWRMYDLPALPTLPSDRDDAYELLDRALSRHTDPECERKSIEGSVSSLLGGLGGMFGIESAYGYMLYKLGLHPQRKKLCADHAFCTWLAWKVTRSCEFRTWAA